MKIKLSYHLCLLKMKLIKFPPAKLTSYLTKLSSTYFTNAFKIPLNTVELDTHITKAIMGISIRFVLTGIFPRIYNKGNLTSVAKPLEKKEESKPVIAPLKETEIHAEKLAGPKVVDKIDLDAIGKKKAEEKAAKPAPEPEPVPEVAKPAKPEQEKPVAGTVIEEQKQEEKQPEEEKRVIVDKSPVAERLSGPKVVDKIDLSKFQAPAKTKKRERIQVGASQKVDVTKVDAGNNPGRRDKDRNRGNQQNKKGKGGNDRFRPAMTEAELEEQQKEIQKQIKETYARFGLEVIEEVHCDYSKVLKLKKKGKTIASSS